MADDRTDVKELLNMMCDQAIQKAEAIKARETTASGPEPLVAEGRGELLPMGTREYKNLQLLVILEAFF